MHKKNIVIYGATGSIGESALNLIRDNKENFNVVGLTCNENINKVRKIANEFDCKNVGIANKELIIQNKVLLKNYTIFAGIEEFQYMISDHSVDIIIFAISGSAPLKLLMEISSYGKTIGLANKECIICLGNLFLDKAAISKTKIIPLDSEHNAIYQLIKNKNVDSIDKYTITASGGNFYKYNYSDLMNITPEEAVTHPKWKMGKKITVDSSTLMNKGLEIIEACILFNIKPNKINALIHPESIIHGFVEFKDSSIHAFLSQPSMEISISSILFDDNSINLDNHKLDLSSIKSLNFIDIDNDKFKAIKIAKASLDHGGLAPAILNYTNELMVNLFLEKKFLFTDIVENNKHIMNQFILDNNNIKNPNIDDITQSFKIIDKYSSKLLSN
jgi:1-deoxy-D-xylulose-5-phosphate reductoisomerase